MACGCGSRPTTARGSTAASSAPSSGAGRRTTSTSRSTSARSCAAGARRRRPSARTSPPRTRSARATTCTTSSTTSPSSSRRRRSISRPATTRSRSKEIRRQILFSAFFACTFQKAHFTSFCFNVFFSKLKMLMNMHKGRMAGIPWKSSVGKSYKAGLEACNSSKTAWRETLNPYGRRPSFWVSDFHHRYLIRTGKDYTGRVPMSPPPGTYQSANHRELRNELPQRDTRALPVRPSLARTVYEASIEQKAIENRAEKREARERVVRRQEEYWKFFTTVQRERAKWCKQNQVRSRGIYKPVIDATEIWG